MPIPTVWFGTTFIDTISSFCKLWVVVSAAATFTVTVLTILSISPVTWSNCDDKLYRCVFIPVTVLAFDLKYNPSLVLPTLTVESPI